MPALRDVPKVPAHKERPQSAGYSGRPWPSMAMTLMRTSMPEA